MSAERHPGIPSLVVVTGPPGSGKTTLARSLAGELGLPLVEKDTYKEILAGPLGVTERTDSQRLGGAVFDLMTHVVHDLLRRGISVIVEGNFTERSSLFRELPRCRLVQVHVGASSGVLRERLATRQGRHAVHYDAEAAEEVAARAAAGEWDPLELDGELVLVDTTEAFPSPEAIAGRC